MNVCVHVCFVLCVCVWSSVCVQCVWRSVCACVCRNCVCACAQCRSCSARVCINCVKRVSMCVCLELSMQFLCSLRTLWHLSRAAVQYATIELFRMQFRSTQVNTIAVMLRSSALVAINSCPPTAVHQILLIDQTLTSLISRLRHSETLAPCLGWSQKRRYLANWFKINLQKGCLP